MADSAVSAASSPDKATASVSQQPHDTQQPPCLLLQLPAELRIHIYELAFAYENWSCMELFDADPFPRALLLTCREIYHDTAALYQQARLRYWRITDFNTPIMTRGVALTLLPALRERDIRLVKRLVIAGGDEDGELASYSLLRDGLWHVRDCVSSSFSDGDEYLILPPKEERTVAEHDLLGDHLVHLKEYFAEDERSLCAFLSLELVSSEDRERMSVYAQGRGLSLWELEGAMRYFLPHC
ncbi:hypothetical protein B0A55_12331 [Friedmanniomyces simplex]|uniref:F-box domain-containing protein n=1 Tax=Friedmanniomyces simplex TaxID=329884 RepID=A0A4U0W512_9PEZI|nr:hypothetical protein B0A55_12331 [Friedmanniomyces simplex]